MLTWKTRPEKQKTVSVVDFETAVGSISLSVSVSNDGRQTWRHCVVQTYGTVPGTVSEHMETWPAEAAAKLRQLADEFEAQIGKADQCQ